MGNKHSEPVHIDSGLDITRPEESYKTIRNIGEESKTKGFFNSLISHPKFVESAVGMATGLLSQMSGKKHFGKRKHKRTKHKKASRRTSIKNTRKTRKTRKTSKRDEEVLRRRRRSRS